MTLEEEILELKKTIMERDWAIKRLHQELRDCKRDCDMKKQVIAEQKMEYSTLETALLGSVSHSSDMISLIIKGRQR